MARANCPTTEQLCELFAQIVAGRVTGKNLQGFLQNPDFLKPEESSLKKIFGLEKIFKVQVERLIGLGFHGELKINLKEYRASIPKLDPQPEQFVGRFDIPLLVDPRLSLKKQLELAGIENRLNLNSVKNFDKIVTPKNPYWIWIQDGKWNYNKSPDDCRREFAKDERGLVVVEGVALYIQHPDIWRDHFVDLVGSQYESDDVPYLGVWVDSPKLSRGWSGAADSRRTRRAVGSRGTASCGIVS